MKKKTIWVTLAFFCAALILSLGTAALSGEGRIHGLITALEQLTPEELSQVLEAFVEKGVPKTGSTYNDELAIGDDGELQKGLEWPIPRFTVNLNSQGEPDGTVTDNLTGLVWTREPNIWGHLPDLDWYDACEACDQLADGVGGLSDGSVAGDWRLPNVRELQSLIHYGFNHMALPNTEGTGKWNNDDPFHFPVYGSYWSSTTRESWKTMAWVVDMIEGQLGFRFKTYPGYVWCVRDPK